ncbi:uncharacterized protein LOC143185172 [Calliopsis andreniformis]|uniref:uncharacterized protein LOC143185172 n=1 Tax=Calliopsis andreniformis TaxID=337506 RepID=UPI003FCECF8B
MKAKVGFVLLICNLVTWSTGNDNFLGDDYIEPDGDVESVDLDKLRLLRDYVYRNGENRRNINDEFENWRGRWLPERPDDPIPPPKVFPKDSDAVVHGLETLHGVPMGQPSVDCDDAKTNLTMDWDGSPIDYTCYGKKLVPDKETIPIQYCERIPKNYVAIHKCMHERIDYDDNIPLYGAHRPLWPIYGEYKFLPKQRWLHSLEHGAIVVLYHPCANPLEVKRLKNLVSSCLRRHVITPYNLLNEDRPLALVSWGCRYTMSYVNPHLATAFIREHALRGPEGIPRDGDFNEGLLHQAETVSDLEDTKLCPNIRN